jgi:hypothetical protein
MDDETAALRDLFLNVAGEERVTEPGTPERGSLLDLPTVRDRLADIVAELVDADELTTALDPDHLPDLVIAVYDGATDDEIATELDAEPEQVARARLDCGLVRDADLDIPDREALDECLRDGTPAACADRLGLDSVAVERYTRARGIVAERGEGTASVAEHIERAFADTDLSAHRTAGVRDDGLREAAEDIETDVEF